MIHYLQIVDSHKQPPHRLKCIQSLKDNLGDNKYDVIEIPYCDDHFKIVAMADEIRLVKAAENKDLCYVDTDCFISIPFHSIVNVENDIPYFAIRETEEDNYPDIFYFYVNNRCDYFKKYLSADLLSKSRYSVTVESLKALKEFAYIPDNTYYHQYTTLNDAINFEKIRDYESEIKKYTKKLAAIRRHVELMAMVIN